MLNSHAVGMAVVRPNGFKINFVRNPFSGSAARFFVIILKCIFTLIYGIKIFEKKFLDAKIISFSNLILYESVPILETCFTYLLSMC